MSALAQPSSAFSKLDRIFRVSGKAVERDGEQIARVGAGAGLASCSFCSASFVVSVLHGINFVVDVWGCLMYYIAGRHDLGKIPGHSRLYLRISGYCV